MYIEIDGIDSKLRISIKAVIDWDSMAVTGQEMAFRNQSQDALNSILEGMTEQIGILILNKLNEKVNP